jgi:hypothetical protein
MNALVAMAGIAAAEEARGSSTSCPSTCADNPDPVAPVGSAGA